MIFKNYGAFAFCPVKTAFGTFINRFLINAHYEVLRPSEHR